MFFDKICCCNGIIYWFIKLCLLMMIGKIERFYEMLWCELFDDVCLF